MTNKKFGKNQINRREFLILSAALAAGLVLPSFLYGVPNKISARKFHFVVASDVHVHNTHYCQAFDYVTSKGIMDNPAGAGDFIVINGDMDPFVRVKKIIEKNMIMPLKKHGIDYGFYPVIGNHDLYNTSGVEEFRTEIPEKTQTRAIINYNKTTLKNIVNWGPKFDSKLLGYENNGSQYTTYSFDHKNSHFIVLDLYYGNSKPGRGNGNFNKETEEWLKKDLENNSKKNIFVFGHQPVTSYDTASGKQIAEGDYIYNNPDKLQKLLEEYKVKIYFSGHTHQYGAATKNGVTYINTGQGMTPDNNSYVMVFVDGDKISYRVYNYSKKEWEEYSHIL